MLSEEAATSGRNVGSRHRQCNVAVDLRSDKGIGFFLSFEQCNAERLQVSAQDQDVGESLVRVLGKELGDRCRHRPRSRRGVARDRLWFGVPLQLKHLWHAAGSKWGPSRQQRVHYAAEAVLVAFLGNGFAFGLFGRHVVGRSEHGRRRR